MKAGKGQAVTALHGYLILESRSDILGVRDPLRGSENKRRIIYEIRDYTEHEKISVIG